MSNVLTLPAQPATLDDDAWDDLLKTQMQALQSVRRWRARIDTARKEHRA